MENSNLETNNREQVSNWSKKLSQRRKSFKRRRKHSPCLFDYGKMDLEGGNKLTIPFLMKTNLKISKLTLDNETKEKQNKKNKKLGKHAKCYGKEVYLLISGYFSFFFV